MSSVVPIWENVKQKVKGKLPSALYERWILPLQAERKGSGLILHCPNNFFLRWLHDNYKDTLEMFLHEQDSTLSLVLVVDKGAVKGLQAAEEFEQMSLPSLPKNGRQLDPNFTIDKFVVGKCNEFAYGLVRGMIDDSLGAEQYVLILADPGLGKSHLSQSIAHAVHMRNPRLRIIYISAEEFLDSMIAALKGKTIERFKERFRQADILVFEEIHFLGGKDKTQEALASIMDILLTERRKIVFTSLLLPNDIPNMRLSLRSRLSGAILATMNAPDDETRRRLIEHKANGMNITLPKEVVDILVTNVTGDVRHLEACIRTLKAKSIHLRREINPELAYELMQIQNPITQSPRSILDLVAHYFKVEVEALRSKSRKAVHAHPRSIYAYLAREFSGATLEDIASLVNREHSTIIYEIEKISHLAKRDRRVLNEIRFLSDCLQQRDNHARVH